MEKKNRKILLSLVFLILISFILVSSPIASFSGRIALNLSRFPLRLVNLSLTPYQAIVSSIMSLKENRLLKKENQLLKVQLIQLKEAESENRRLSRLLDFKEISKFSLEVSRVVALDASNLRKSLIIDKGKVNDIKVGNPVIVPEGVVGMVVEVGQSVSRIILMDDLDFSMAAKVLPSEAIGVISGSLEGTCRLRYLDLDEDIEVGDEIVSSGKNSRFPAGIPIGTVVKVSAEESGLSLFAIVKPKAKLSALEEVLVITNY